MTDVNVSVWPEFMLNDPVANEHWGRLRDDFAAFQLALLDEQGEVVAANNAAPLAWDGTDDGLPAGWDDQFLRQPRRAGGRHAAGHARRAPGDGAVRPAGRRTERRDGQRDACQRGVARLAGSDRLRPADRQGPLPADPIEAYARWTRDDGLPLDPWIRLHVRLGGRLVRPSPASMRIEGSSPSGASGPASTSRSPATTCRMAPRRRSRWTWQRTAASTSTRTCGSCTPWARRRRAPARAVSPAASRSPPASRRGSRRRPCARFAGCGSRGPGRG